MQITFDCPKCLKLVHEEMADTSQGPLLRRVWLVSPAGDPAKSEGGSLTDCLICGCGDLWRQKDFDQRLGVFIVGLGILLSTIAFAYMMPELAMIVLLVFGLADWVLYVILPDRLVCYRCHAQYRHIPKLPAVPAFDLEVNERYRQEAIRLRQASTPSAR